MGSTKVARAIHINLAGEFQVMNQIINNNIDFQGEVVILAVKTTPAPIAARLEIQETTTMRVPDLTYDSLDADQKAIHDKIVAGVRGKVHGPFRALLHRPLLLDRVQELGLYCRFNSGLEPRLSELAILVMSAMWGVSGEWHDHYQNAVDLGVSPDALEAVRTGRPPIFGKDDEQALYDFTSELHRNRGVSDQTYLRAVDAIGEGKLMDLVGVLGYYTLISMMLKVYKVPLPEGVKDPLANA